MHNDNSESLTAEKKLPICLLFGYANHCSQMPESILACFRGVKRGQGGHDSLGSKSLWERQVTG